MGEPEEEIDAEKKRRKMTKEERRLVNRDAYWRATVGKPAPKRLYVPRKKPPAPVPAPVPGRGIDGGTNLAWKTLQNRSKFCPCPACGWPICPGNRYCPGCKEKLKWV